MSDIQTQRGSPITLAEATPRQVHEWLRAGQAVLIDVREPDEHAREWIPGSRLLPLSRFNATDALQQARPDQKLVLHCRSGRRAAEAGAMVLPAVGAGPEVVNLAGGIEAWKSAGLPVDANTRMSRLSVMRQVQLVVGVCLLIGSALAWFVHPAFLAIPASFGAGLTFAGATGTCALASVLGAMPWNRVANGSGSCATGACS